MRPRRHDYEEGDLFDCCDCGESYAITPDQRRWYERKGLSIPKRCKPCRDEKRARNAARDAA